MEKQSAGYAGFSKIGNLHLNISADRETASHRTGSEISEFLSQQSKSVLLLVSGGSSLSVLDHIKIDRGDHLTITLLDERFGVADTDSNFYQLTKTDFYKRAQAAGCHFINFSGETAEDTARTFEESLITWRNENQEGEMVALAGIGPDGHTAGMMPMPEEEDLFNRLFVGDRLVVSYDASGKNPFPLRITTTMTFLQSLDHVFVFAVGAEKRNALKSMRGEGEISATPALALSQLDGVLYIDKDLADASGIIISDE